MHKLPKKLGIEYKTIKAMVNIYCNRYHRNNTLCDGCKDFISYANEKLDRCPYGQEKPTCNKCPIHCYKPEQRALASKIMRFAGPRMLIYHPILAIIHLLAAKKTVPSVVPDKASNRHHRNAAKQIASKFKQ